MWTLSIAEPAEKQVNGPSIDFQRRKCVCNWENCEEIYRKLVFDLHLISHPWADDFF
jgi:hypothetical protein